MGIEIYEEKVKNRTLEKQHAQKKPDESKESKEKESEIIETVRLCSEYHDKLDTTGYFNSKAAKIASVLLPGFLRIKKEILPESMQNVITHRIAYLEMMSELNKNQKILVLLDKLEPKFLGSLGLFDKNFNTVKAECEKFPEFKRLTRDDFKMAYLIVVKGIGHLQSVTKDSKNWQDDARKYLQNRKYKFSDKRADDQVSAKNLQAGLQTAAKNLRMLEIKTQSKSA